MAIEDDFLRVIEHRDIRTYFQPIVTADDHSVYAYEALSRGPLNSELFNPLQLFAQAKQQQKLFALESICRTNAIEQYQYQQLPGKLFLNISPETLLQPDHQRGLTMELVNSFNLCPEQVVIEITEHSPTHDYELMRRAVRHYQNEGFSIALDDLGAGYSSLRLWGEVQPNFVKIDRYFVQDIGRDRFKREFVNFILGLARSVGSTVIAEGIESNEEYVILRELGADLLQGYYFAKPCSQPLHSLQPAAQVVAC